MARRPAKLLLVGLLDKRTLTSFLRMLYALTQVRSRRRRSMLECPAE
jgi:hypothetical protein